VCKAKKKCFSASRRDDLSRIETLNAPNIAFGANKQFNRCRSPQTFLKKKIAHIFILPCRPVLLLPIILTGEVTRIC
jgi:hypothetical protein